MIKVNGNVVEPTIFPDGTKKINLLYVNDSFVLIEWYYNSDDELVTLMFIVKEIRDKWPEAEIHLQMPYIPNSRFDRIKSNDEVFTLKWFAEIINSLNFTSVQVIDPHSYVSEALIDRLEVISPKNIVTSFIDKNFLEDCSLNKFALFYPDSGAMKRYSDMFNIPYTYGLKNRDWETGKILGLDVIGTVNFIKGRTILIIDDICSKGGTFYHSAKKLKELGAEEVYLYVTHCENTILEGDLLTSGLIEKVFTTNSIFTKEHGKIEIYNLRGDTKWIQ